MTLQLAKKYRNYQLYAVVSSVLFQGFGAYYLATAEGTTMLTNGTLVWSVLSLCSLLMLLMGLRAAKLEVLEHVGITMPVYEQLIITALRRKR